MQPTTSRDFLRVARQRFNAAEVLLREGVTLDAQYIGGYAVECALKALILEVADDREREVVRNRITRSAAMHRFDVLLGELRNRGVGFPVDLAKRLRRSDWTVDLRYETGRRDTGETVAFLRTAAMIVSWVEGQLP